LDWKAKLSGRFVVFDGPDGSGKTTQIERLRDFLTAEGVDATCTKDPGGTEIGERIRGVLLHHDLSQMDIACETLLFMASRAQLCGEVIRPAMNAGNLILCDRYISATCAYQGAAGYDVQGIIELGRYAVGDTWPDLTLVFDVPVEAGFERTGRKPHHAGKNRASRDAGQGMLIDGVEPDAMEARPIEYHRRVRERFLNLPSSYPGTVETVSGSGSVDDVHTRIIEVLTRVDL
jgi:dTMP kinase